MKRYFFNFSCILLLFFLMISCVFAADYTISQKIEQNAISQKTAQKLLERALATSHQTGIYKYSHLTDALLDQAVWAIGCGSCSTIQDNNPEIFKGYNDFGYAFDTVCLRSEIAKRFGRLPQLKNIQHEGLKIANNGDYIYVSMCGDAGADSIDVRFASMKTHGNLTIIKGRLIDLEDGRNAGTLTIGVIPDSYSPFNYVFESIDLKYKTR